MSSHHNRLTCRGIPSRPAAVVATSYDVDGQLRDTVVSGSNSKFHPLSYELRDEGVYILYQDRALQIAAPPCDQRKCNISHICHCDTCPVFTPSCLPARHDLKQIVAAWPMWKPCQDCLSNWLRLYQATEAAHKLGMQFLENPKTLTWATLQGHQTFHYDSELEEQPIRSNNNGACIGSTSSKSCCPHWLFEWMKDGWCDFVRSRCCIPGSIMALPDDGDRSAVAVVGYSNNGRCDANSDSEWDDLGIPISDIPKNSAPTSPSSHDDSDGYDLINDLIEEEFPKLRKITPAKADVHKLENDSNTDDEDGSSVPAIIPPKDMAVGRGLSLVIASLDVYRPRIGSSGSFVHSKPQLAPGTKRSYRDLVKSQQGGIALAEELSRVKQRKREHINLQLEPRRRRGSRAHRLLSWRLNRIPLELALT
ncbi:hypothetical protein F4677DRAFT_100365 [Hypoxylon crocopeplum]|nr:hypothetical protein F4677DRAFT_100365 [Hypoxylon crocopeplum]